VKEPRRWGPAGDAAYRLVVPPRAHQAAWCSRCALQLPLEAPGAILVYFAVVPRDRVTALDDPAMVKRMLPHAAPFFESKELLVDVKIVGERAPLRRVPARDNHKELPPAKWESAWLPMDRVLVAIVVRRSTGSWRPPSVGHVRGDLPSPSPSVLELLRVEYVLPPATRQANAEKALHAAVRKLANEMHLQAPPGQHALRQVVVQHGSVLANLGVPREQALEWLRGSGCGGLYLRPFWTPQTAASIQRDKFSMLWLRGKADRGPEIWGIFRHRPGVAGLLLSGRDVALRVDATANVDELQAQLALAMGNSNERFRQAAAGQRWWRLGPLTEAECWRASALVQSMGLAPLRGELRYGRMGRWRHAVYFAAVGTPTKLSLDTGSRDSSEAYLAEVGPPPRPSAPTAVARTRGVGGELPVSSTWGGPRQNPPPSASTSPHVRPAPQPTASSSTTAPPGRPAAKPQAARPSASNPRAAPNTFSPTSAQTIGTGGVAGPHQ
jgi:hypothetical protein